jgi:hypothetical protein
LFKESSQNCVLKHPQSSSSLNVRDQVSHPYKTTGRIMVIIYFNLCIPLQQAGRQETLDRMVSIILRI